MENIEITDYNVSIQTPQLVKAPMLAGGRPVMKGRNLVKYTGGFCVVYPYETPLKKYAVRCWHFPVRGIRERTHVISEQLKAAALPYFVGFEYVVGGIATPKGAQDIIVMDWIDSGTLKNFIAANLHSPDALRRLADNFRTMAADLHKAGLAHGDLQHGNIMCKPDGSILLVDYDSMYVPGLDGESDDIKGLPGYQHPARQNNKYVNRTLDYFSELIIYTSIIALAKYPRMWDELQLEDTDTLLFSSEDLKSPDSASIFRRLEEDSELKPLSEALRAALRANDIADLLPLEKAIIGRQKALVDDIAGKWKDNGYVRPRVDYAAAADDIAKRW